MNEPIPPIDQNALRATLAPDWNKAPIAARFYVIDPSGYAYWVTTKPTHEKRTLAGWNPTDETTIFVRHKTPNWEKIIIPLGLDWRFCIWEREQ